MKRLLFAALFAASAFGAVQQSITQLGNTNNWVLAFNWTADGAGAVPVTNARLEGCCQGYLITQVEMVPGTVAPTSGYSVAINDAAGVDALGGAGASLSSTVAASFPTSLSAPPLQGTFSLVITGQSVAGAKGVVYVFLSKPGSVNVAALGGGQGFFTQTGSHTVRTVQSKLQESVSVEDFGAKGDGTTNDSTACQSASNALTALGGGVLNFGPKTYICNFTIGSNIWVKGSGVGATTIKSRAGSNADVIKGTHFASLTNTPIVAPETRGDNYTTITDLTIDGNKSVNSAGFGVRIWGMSMYWENVTAQNCVQDGFWTEYTTGAGTAPFPLNPKLGMSEGFFHNIKVAANGGNGWTFEGPNDSVISGMRSNGNGGWALFTDTKFVGPTLYHLGALDHLTDFNNYLDGTGGIFIGTAAQILSMDGVIVSDSPIGLEIDYPNGDMHMTNMLVAGNSTYGLKIGGSHMSFQGEISRNAIGIEVYNLLDSFIDAHGDTNPLSILHTSEVNGNTFRFMFNVPVAGTLVTLTTPWSVNSWVQLQGYGAVTSVFTQIPGLFNGSNLTVSGNAQVSGQLSAATIYSVGQLAAGGIADCHSPLCAVGLPVYANNAAALVGGLVAGAIYRITATDTIAVVH